ncbi:hypothetical protein ACFLWI_02480 [Chloroflexota bacterium]
MTTLEAIAKMYKAYETTDNNEFRRKARVLQSIWREERGYLIGEHYTPKYGSRVLGSRLEKAQAHDELLNYLTPTIRQVVRDEVINKKKSKGKLYSHPRIFDDLLSSQPLCFNLFGELQRNLSLATSVFTELLPNRVSEVTGIEFEYSPGRGDLKYTGDRTAFDVYVTFKTLRNKEGFIGIEVKYHENLQGRASQHTTRYDDIARDMGCFKPESLVKLQRKPLQQLWRDHLLAGILRQVGGFADGIYTFLYPKDNLDCVQAVAKYRECLAYSSTFEGWTLENITTAVKKHTKAKWIDDFTNRYLDFSKLGDIAARR